ncbi:MAG: hypothetical protein GQ564_18025 [Bacteroidales bacterium]|nr:hypothetical protein [Bacteroidales bacterium]
MKNYILAIIFVAITSIPLIAQTEVTPNNFFEKKAVNLQVTTSNISLGFKAISNFKLSTELDVGIASFNEDFIYNDYVIDLKVFYSIRKKEKTNLYAGSILGFEFINDPTFNLTSPFIGAIAGYEYYFGKKKRSGISIELGYIYGKKQYSKSYTANWGTVEYIGTFKNSPLFLGLGYSYYF